MAGISLASHPITAKHMFATGGRVDSASQMSIFLVGLALLVAILGLGMR